MRGRLREAQVLATPAAQVPLNVLRDAVALGQHHRHGCDDLFRREGGRQGQSEGGGEGGSRWLGGRVRHRRTLLPQAVVFFGRRYLESLRSIGNEAFRSRPWWRSIAALSGGATSGRSSSLFLRPPGRV